MQSATSTTSGTTLGPLLSSTQTNGWIIGGGTTSGVTYELFLFHNSGTITFTGSGTVYYVLIGGGAASAFNGTGGGGGGVKSGSFSSSGTITYTVTVGAGGSQTTSGTGGNGGSSSIVGGSVSVSATGGLIGGSSGGTSKGLTAVSGITESGNASAGNNSDVSNNIGYTFSVTSLTPSYTGYFAGGGGGFSSIPFNIYGGATGNIPGTHIAYSGIQRKGGGSGALGGDYPFAVGGSGSVLLFYVPTFTTTFTKFTLTGSYFISVYGQYTLFNFYSSGSFRCSTNISGETLVVAGGGCGGSGSGNFCSGGGGGGGVGIGRLTYVANTTYTITVGTGGTVTNFYQNGGSGGNSSIVGGSINETAYGGGGGGGISNASTSFGVNGGSGGGSGGAYTGGTVGQPTQGSGTLTYYGNRGAIRNSNTSSRAGGGGGGAGNAAVQATVLYYGGNGGSGIQWGINGSYYGGGGGGGSNPAGNVSAFLGGIGGIGGGGNGGTSGAHATNGAPNTGGGGGGIGWTTDIYTTCYGGSGVVIIAILTSLVS